MPEYGVPAQPQDKQRHWKCTVYPWCSVVTRGKCVAILLWDPGDVERVQYVQGEGETFKSNDIGVNSKYEITHINDNKFEGKLKDLNKYNQDNRYKLESIQTKYPRINEKYPRYHYNNPKFY